MNDQEILDLIDLEILEAKRLGLEINMNRFGIKENSKEIWEPYSCIVCGIGAVLRGKKVASDDICEAFAYLVGKDIEWSESFADGTDPKCRVDDYNRDSEELSAYYLGRKVLEKYK